MEASKYLAIKTDEEYLLIFSYVFEILIKVPKEKRGLWGSCCGKQGATWPDLVLVPSSKQGAGDRHEGRMDKGHCGWSALTHPMSSVPRQHLDSNAQSAQLGNAV